MERRVWDRIEAERPDAAAWLRDSGLLEKHASRPFVAADRGDRCQVRFPVLLAATPAGVFDASDQDERAWLMLEGRLREPRRSPATPVEQDPAPDD